MRILLVADDVAAGRAAPFVHAPNPEDWCAKSATTRVHGQKSVSDIQA
jgi:hypothetical protein